MEPSDTELMERFGAGDDEAFRQLVARHEKRLLNFFWRRCFDRVFAEDCTQEVFLRLVRHRGRWKPSAKFTTYLYRIAENLWIDRYRSRRSHPPPASLNLPVGDDGGEIADRVANDARMPEQLAGDRELSLTIRAAIENLSEQQRSVFVLGEIQGMKYQDIGEILGIPVGTVKSRMHAAVHRLRGLLADLDRERSL